MRGGFRYGAPGGNRTPDQEIRRLLLYPLSYWGLPLGYTSPGCSPHVWTPRGTVGAEHSRGLAPRGAGQHLSLLFLCLAAACTAARCAGEQLPPQANRGAAHLRGAEAHVHHAAGCRVEDHEVHNVAQADHRCDKSAHILVEIAQIGRNVQLVAHAVGHEEQRSDEVPHELKVRAQTGRGKHWDSPEQVPRLNHGATQEHEQDGQAGVAHDVAVASDECHCYRSEHTDAFADGLDEFANDFEGIPLREEGCRANHQPEGGVPDVLAAGRGKRLDPAEFEAGHPAHERHFGEQQHTGESPKHELARPGGVLARPEQTHEGQHHEGERFDGNAEGYECHAERAAPSGVAVALGVVEAAEHEHGHERVVVAAGDKRCDEQRVRADLPEGADLVEAVCLGEFCHVEENTDDREHGEQAEVEEGEVDVLPRQAHDPLFKLEGDRTIRGRGFRPHGVRTVLHEVRDFGDSVLVRVEAVRHDHALTVVGEHIAAVDGEGEDLRQGPAGDDGNHPTHGVGFVPIAHLLVDAQPFTAHNHGAEGQQDNAGDDPYGVKPDGANQVVAPKVGAIREPSDGVGPQGDHD